MRAGPCERKRLGTRNSRMGRPVGPTSGESDAIPSAGSCVWWVTWSLSCVLRACIRASAWSILASTGVGSRVHLPECIGCDECVDLRRRDRGVAEELLHDAHIGAALEQVRRERMAQGVR